MIIGFILHSLYVLFFNLLIVLPVGGSLPASVLSAIASLGGMMYSWNSFLPVSALLDVMLWVVTLKLSIFGVRVILWIVATVRGSGMSGTAS